MKKTLVELFSEIGNFSGVCHGGNDKGSTHTYLETYDRLFAPFRNFSTIMEIGLATGDSILLWDRYFENSTIIGVDISIVFSHGHQYRNNITLLETDATKPDLLTALDGVELDLCIDDSDHQTISQITTFNMLKHKMKPTGLYILEDILALDIEREKYLALHPHCEIIDMRHTGRFDNVLIVYSKF